MPKFIMTVGLPASGKSTWCKQMTNVVYISSDEYREWLLNDVNDQEQNTYVFKAMFDNTINSLNNGKDVLYDATNINYKRRKHLVSEIKRLCKDVSCECVLFATTYEQCLKNNSMRERKVSEDVIKKMYMNFYVPHWFEGWDDINIIYNNSNEKPEFNRGAYESFSITYMKKYNQNNPQHIYDVYNHSKAIAFQYKKDDCRRYAAILHDCMEKKCEKIDEKGFSHFYSHANISAYYVLTHPKIVNCKSFVELLEIIFYITYHMFPYNITKEKTALKYKKIFGEDLYNNLIDFYEKDKIASKDVIFNYNYQNIYIKQEECFIGYTRFGDIFYIDKTDIDICKKYTWCIKNRKSNDFRLVSMSDGEMKFLHRIIMEEENIDGLVVDHINHKQFDNRKSNLRVCSSKENSYNTSLSKNNTSGINGVSQMKNGKFRAYIFKDYKQIHLGLYNTLDEAKTARDIASKEQYGEFANLEI